MADIDEWRRQTPAECYSVWFGRAHAEGYMAQGRVMHLHAALHSKRVVSRWQLFEELQQLGRKASLRMLLDMHDKSTIAITDPAKLRRAWQQEGDYDIGLCGHISRQYPRIQ